MPRKLTIRSLLTALTMAVVSLCGGGKAIAAQKNTPSVVETPRSVVVRSGESDIIAPATETVTEAVQIDDTDDGVARVGADRAAFVVGACPFTEIRSTGAASLSLHQTGRRYVWIRPPTRGPPINASWNIESTSCA